jgi:hypothetical protein
MDRFDFYFSYWIFAWCCIYWTNFSQNIPSPQFALIVAFISNLALLIAMICYGTSAVIISTFIIVMVLIKIIPLSAIWSNKTINGRDIYSTIALFGIYVLWIVYWGRRPGDYIKDIRDIVLHNKPSFPGMSYLLHA